MDIADLPGSLIGPRPGSRPIDKAKAQVLAESIKDVGLISPIIVASGKRIRAGSEVDGWDILAGQHRFHAMFTILNMRKIPCCIFDGDEAHRDLVQIDENLIRNELTAAERAQHIAKRKELYEGLHPETARGSNRQGPCGQFGHTDSICFNKATASATGKSERSVRRDAHRGEQLASVLPRITNTSLDKPSELDALVRLDPAKRDDLVDRAAAGEVVSAQPATESNDPGSKPRKTRAIATSDVSELKRKLADKADEIRTLKTRKQSAEADVARLLEEVRSKDALLERTAGNLQHLQEEVRRLNESGTITVAPNDSLQDEDIAAPNQLYAPRKPPLVNKNVVKLVGPVKACKAVVHEAVSVFIDETPKEQWLELIAAARWQVDDLEVWARREIDVQNMPAAPDSTWRQACATVAVILRRHVNPAALADLVPRLRICAPILAAEMDDNQTKESA